MRNKWGFVGVVGVLVLCGACKNPFFPALEYPAADPEVPVIAVQPEGADYFIGDEAADLVVSAAVGDKGVLSYQWYRTTEDLNEGGALIDGETGTMYTPPVDTAGTVYYYVIITNTLNKKTAVAVSDTAAVTVYEIEEGTTVIDSAAVTVTGPAKGGTPDTKATVDGAGFSCGEVSWSPGDNPFLGGTVYTAIVTLTADDGYVFAPGLAASINHHHAVVAHNTLHAVTLSLAFDATLTKTVIGIAVKDQPEKLAYTHGDALDLSGLAITLTHDDGTSEEIALDGFGTSILTEPEDGATLSHTGHDGQPVAVLFGGFTAHTANLAVNRAAVSSVEVTVTGPAKGGTPHTTATADGAGYTCGEVSWSPEHNPFLGGTVYTASVTLTADEGYTFTGLTAATINGNNADVTDNTGATVTLSFEFAATNTRTVTAIAVKTQPANLIYTHGDALDLSGLVITLTHDDNTSEDAALADFVLNNISENPANGAVLHHSTHNAQPVVVSYGGLTANTNTLTVNAKALTVTGAAHTRPYDGTTTATGVIVTLSGIVGGDDVTAGTVTAEYAGAAAGTQAVNITGVTLTGSAAGNYTVTLPAGAITVTGGITKANPSVTWPTAADITYGAALSMSALGGGAGAGVFAWTDGTIIPTVTNSGYEVTFTPTDAANYNTLTQNVNVTVNKANPSVTWPTGLTAAYGQTLVDISLPGNGTSVPAGTFTWTAPNTPVGNMGTQSFNMIFTPTDTANYNTLTQSVSITVSYLVSFNTNGGGTIPNQSIATGGVVSRPSNPTRNTYVFDFWYADVGLTIPYNFATIVTDNITLYAKWISQTDINAMVNKDMVWVAGGSFQMGQNGDGTTGNVTPVHTVTLSGFYIGKYEVTQAQYQTVMGTNPSNFLTGADAGETQNRRPVERVSWYDALVFCNKLSISEGLSPAYRINGSTDPSAWGTVPTSSDATWNAVEVVSGSNGYRLPTEAQWEYAAKGGPSASTPYKIYSGSDTVDDVAWYTSNSGDKTHEVGKKLSNELGIHDMSGNVIEWCWDWYGTYPSEAQENPVGASSGSNRVYRGGGWRVSATGVRSASRSYNGPYYWYDHIGFRLLCPAQ